MKVQTFMGKIGIEALHQMDENINRWLADHEVAPTRITQCFGHERDRQGRGEEPVVITSVWYE